MSRSDAPTSPSINIRQATLLNGLESTEKIGSSYEEERDTLSPLGPSLSSKSILQPGAFVPELADELPGELIQEYKCAQGKYADVYRGKWVPRPGDEPIPVAIKCLREVSMMSSTTERAKKERNDLRMKREAVVWQRARHPNVLQLYGFRSGEEPSLVSPYCPYGSIWRYLEMHPQVTFLEKLKLLHQASLGLAYLHSQVPPISHGDVKPENVLVNEQRQATFCDFGLARVLQSLDSHSGFTTSGHGQGSKGYQAPELINDEDRPSMASDIYAFAGLMLAILSGKPPFWQMSTGKTVIAIAGGEMTDPAFHAALSADDSLWKLMQQCWALDPHARPAMVVVSATLEAEIKARCQTQ